MAKTCDKYLSGIRMLHLRKGFDVSVLRPAIVSLLLKGSEHFEDIENKLNNKEKRIRVTLTVMKLLKRRIKKINWPETKKRLVWALRCVAWNGSFRIHELLSRKREEFDPICTLLEQDVNLAKINGVNVGILKIYLKTQN